MQANHGGALRLGLAALFLFGTASVRASRAATYTTLHTFQPGAGGGAPGPLLLDKAGHLWGAAAQGGKQNGGVFFELKPPASGQTQWHFRPVVKFQNATGTDPLGPFVEREGDFYGPTSTGGAGKGGVVYHLTQAGALTDIQSFSKDGPPPRAVATDKAGNLYGEAIFQYYGEKTGDTIFKIAPDGSFTTLYTFGRYYRVSPGLLVEKSGALVGTALDSKPADGGFIFRLLPNGTFRKLYAFTGGTDGAFPNAPLVADAAGNLYGTAQDGAINNSGTVFKFGTDGSLTTLYSFQGNGLDGKNPEAGVVLDAAGNVYGTTAYGGTDSGGTVFEIGTDGTETILHSFAGGMDGETPQNPVVIGPQRQVFGSTELGGSNAGIVFEITP